MAIVLEKTAVENSTFVIRVTFYDENDEEMIPTDIKWTLTNERQQVVNDREDQVVTPDSTIDIVLTGDDLDISAGVGNSRTLTLEATYTSSYGIGLKFKEAIYFSVENISSIG